MHRPRFALLSCSLVALACDVASEDLAPAAPVGDHVEPRGLDVELPKPQPAPQPVPSIELPPVAVPSPDSAPSARSLVDRATTTVAQNLERGLGAARGVLARPSAPRTETSKPRRTAKAEPTGTILAEPKPTPSPRSPGKACDVETYRWKSVRVPLGGTEGTVKLKNGHWDGSDRHSCHWVSLVAGPRFGDLDEDGRAEAYFIAQEVLDGRDTEGTCSLGMSYTSETLYAFELDAACKPRMLDAVDEAGKCDFGSCEELTLRIQGQHVLYGRRRFGWSGDSLRRIR